MLVMRERIETTLGPADRFSGMVYIDPIATPSEVSRISASSVHFAPGARTAWHAHPKGQTIFVTEGVAPCSAGEGRSKRSIPASESSSNRARITGNGATPERFMTHLSLVEVDEHGESATWGSHVTNEEYGAS